jgi:hypothetical protein
MNTKIRIGALAAGGVMVVPSSATEQGHASITRRTRKADRTLWTLQDLSARRVTR